MFNKSIIAAVITLYISPVMAIEGGQSISAKNNPEMVSLQSSAGQCSGMIVGNKFVVTAAHCGDGTGSVVKYGDNQTVNVLKSTLHPLYTLHNDDVAIWELASRVPQTGFISTIEPEKGKTYSIFGWASGTLRTLRTADVVGVGATDSAWSDEAFDTLYDPDKGLGTGYGEPGDSGGACADDIGAWGITQGGGDRGDGTKMHYCQRLTPPQIQEWVLDTIDGWAYPTVVNGQGALSVKIQNLHPAGDTIVPWVEGALEMIDNHCPSVIEPFGICDVQVKGRGKLHLSSNDVVEVNKSADFVIIPPTSPVNPVKDAVASAENGEGGGGSTSPYSLVWLLGIALWRKLSKWITTPT